MPQPEGEYSIIGKVGTPYGVRGWLKVFSYTDPVHAIVDYAPWYIDDKATTPSDSRVHGKGLVVKLAGITSPEAAKLLAGKDICIMRSQLPPPSQGTYYWSDLIGMTVTNSANEVMGTVKSLLETGANDVLVIRAADGKEHGIPWLMGRVIQQVDLVKRTIVVDWVLI